MYFSSEALANMSDMELSVGLECIQKEIQKRETEKRNHLIEKFHELWKEMKTAHVHVFYCEPEEEEIQLYDWDNFYFS